MAGKVWITGAGSEAGLITVRALQALRGAEVIIYDDLLDHRILKEAQEGCELICAGKRKNSHKREQEEINELLIDLARKGLKVVRLKGGDPTVFGRGGEEALALEEAGIPYEMIPGVSSCISAPEHFGISITQRGMASSFTVVTGHGDGKTAESYEALASLKGTLVFLMGHSRAEEIAEGLMKAGMDPETPVSVLSCVYMEDEKRVDGVLRTLGETAKKAKAPAILVIGKTAGMHLEVSGSSSEVPDSSKVVPGTSKEEPGTLIIGSQSFTDRMASALEADGLRADKFPCIGIVPQVEEIPADSEYAEYDWLVFTSANGVKIFLDELGRRKTDLRRLAHMKIACIGPGTAAALEKAHLYADLVPKTFTSEALGEALVRAVKPGEKVLILRAEEGNPLLTKRLENERILYGDCKIYSTQYFDINECEAKGPYDFVIFASAGGVRRFLENNALPEGARPVCIGELTAGELERLTGEKAAVAPKCSVEGIRDYIRTWSK